eukprot:343573_1
MGQNTILWIHQHYLKIEKSITLIYKSKIGQEYKNANCITNFILSSYAVLMSSYAHLNATNYNINIEYWYFDYIYKLFTLIWSIVFAHKLYIIAEFIIKYYANFRRNDRFVMIIKLHQINQITYFPLVEMT